MASCQEQPSEQGRVDRHTDPESEPGSVDLETRCARLLQILTEMPDEVMVIDTAFRPVWANKVKREAFKRLDDFLNGPGKRQPEDFFGGPPAEMKDTCYCLIEGNDDICEGCVCRRAMDSMKHVRGVLYEARKSGIIVELSAAPLFSLSDGQRKVVGCVEIARPATQRERVTELPAEFLRCLSERRLLQAVVEGICTRLRYDRARLYAVDQQAGMLWGVVYAGEHPKLSAEKFQSFAFPVPQGLDKVLQRAVKAAHLSYGAKPFSWKESLGYYTATLPEDVRAEIDREGFLELEGVTSIACVPLISGDRRWMVFVDCKAAGRDITDEDLQSLTTLSKFASVAMDAIRHNELLFRFSIIGETSAGPPHQLSKIASVARFGVEVYPQLADTYQLFRQYLLEPPSKRDNEFLVWCLDLISARFSEGKAVPMRGPVQGWAEKLAAAVRTDGKSRSLEVLHDIARIAGDRIGSVEDCAKLLGGIQSKYLESLLAKFVSLLGTVGDKLPALEEMATYADALQTAFRRDKLERIEPQFIPDARRIVRSAARIARDRCARLGVGLTEQYGEEPIPTKLVAGQVFLAWLALLDNAAVAAQSESTGPLVTISVARRTAQKFSVNISNNGSQVPPDKEHLCFNEPFSTREGGTGLGLVMAADWIRNNGGEIHHGYDEKSKVTTFTTVLQCSVGTNGPTGSQEVNA